MRNIQSVAMPDRETLADLYVRQFDRTAHLYTYNPYRQSSYQRRLEDMAHAGERVDRSTLGEALQAYNKRVNPHRAVQAHIDLLARPDSVVVIGGQQAGVLTGPLYTIHKAVTILQLARQQSEKLHRPVIPVFWIAGEDHDYDEVNHIWVPRGTIPPEKIQFDVPDGRKRAVGQRQLITEDAMDYLKRVADWHPDTPYKQQWMKKLWALAEQSDTFSDWFARIFHWLFADEGLVLFDSAAKEFKRIAAPFYTRVIEQGEQLHERVLMCSEQIKQMGYEPQVALQKAQAHLFIEENEERVPLFKQGDTFVTRTGETAYSQHALIEIAQSQPERLSTNVVTRPLLQEYLFPTLASVLGPGEIAYWGLYGQAFSLFGWNMPVLFPRLGFTLLERDVRGTMERFKLSERDALFNLEAFRTQWLEEQDDIGVENLFGSLMTEISGMHETKLRPVVSINQGMAALVEKNRERICRELEYLENKVQQAIRTKHEATLRQFDRVRESLTPQGKPQERVYNLFSFVNQYGWDWLYTLVREPLDLSHTHYIVEL